MRLAHSLADTLVSPLNDSYIDVDVFIRVHHDREQRGAVAHYADLVLQARRKRRIVDNGVIDWVMVRNRIASLASNNAKQIAISIGRLSRELGFRVADGLHDRVIFRELFPIGLTALDPIEEARNNGALTTSQLSARREIDDLVEALALPTRAPGIEHQRVAPAVARARASAITPSFARDAARGRALKTALCFTPGPRFFAPAVRTIASLVEQGDADAFDIFIVCEEADVAPGYERLDPALRARIRSADASISRRSTAASRRKGRFSRAVFRRLFLDRLLPDDLRALRRHRLGHADRAAGPGAARRSSISAAAPSPPPTT